MTHIRRVIKLATVSLLLLVVMTQCSRAEPELAPKIAELVGTWRLIEPDSTYAVTLVFALDTDNPPHDITSFKASGKSSVNDYTVNLFATIDGMMSSDQLGSTKIAGLPDAMQFEQSYFTDLKAIARYELPTEKLLRLYHGGNQPHVLTYEKQN